MQSNFTITLTRQQLKELVQSLSLEECKIVMRLLLQKIAVKETETLKEVFRLPPFEGDFLDRPVDSFNLPPTIASRLKNAGFATVSDIVKKGVEEMEKVRNIGSKTMQEVKTKILAHYSERP